MCIFVSQHDGGLPAADVTSALKCVYSSVAVAGVSRFLLLHTPPTLTAALGFSLPLEVRPSWFSCLVTLVFRIRHSASELLTLRTQDSATQ